MKKWNQRYHDEFKKHSLINQVWDENNLENAWKRVLANKGNAGIDGVTISVFQQNLPQVKRVLIPKDNGRMRPLGIPTVSDRVVQQALKNVLEPIFEETFIDL